MTCPFQREICESKALARRIDQTEPQCQASRARERPIWERRGDEMAMCCSSDSSVLPRRRTFHRLISPAVRSAAVVRRTNGVLSVSRGSHVLQSEERSLL
jgi:hypothetical protein